MSVAAPGWTVRVTVGEVWQLLVLEASPDEPVASLKRRALALATIAPDLADRYEVKVGGALVRDESVGLEAAGIPDGGSVVILARRRRPVR